MSRVYKSTLLWIMAALVCIIILSNPAYAVPSSGTAVKGATAYTAVDSGAGPVSAVIYDDSSQSSGSAIFAAGGPGGGIITDAPAGSKDAGTGADTAAAGAACAPNYTVRKSGGETIYTFEGKDYKKAGSYGEHKLTGYCEAEGSINTASGAVARARHTVSAPSDLPFGTVIIVEGVSGPNASEYNGMYVVEDRGGETLESMKLIDIFCNSYAEADHVSYAGWNSANIWIAEAVG